MKLDITDRHDYNIITAIRGPDAPFAETSELTKDYTTAVLRYFAGMSPSNVVGAIVHHPAKMLAYPLTEDVRQRVQDFLVRESHFRYHIQAGFRSMATRLKCSKAPLSIRKELHEYREFLFNKFDIRF